MKGPDARDVFTHYETMMRLLSEFESAEYAQWLDGVDEACSFNLAQPLLKRNDDTNLIAVNFDPDVRRYSVFKRCPRLMLCQKIHEELLFFCSCKIFLA